MREPKDFADFMAFSDMDNDSVDGGINYDRNNFQRKKRRQPADMADFMAYLPQDDYSNYGDEGQVNIDFNDYDNENNSYIPNLNRIGSNPFLERSNKKPRDIADFMAFIPQDDYVDFGDYGEGNESANSDNFFNSENDPNIANKESSNITDKNDLFGFNSDTNADAYDFLNTTPVTNQESISSIIRNAQMNTRVRDVNAGNSPQNPREGRIQAFNSQNPESFVNPNAGPKRIRSPEGLY